MLFKYSIAAGLYIDIITKGEAVGDVAKQFFCNSVAKPLIITKQGANPSLLGSRVSSRQPASGIIFSRFVHSHKQTHKNRNDSNTC